jgi:hypothetical protein
LNTVSTPPRRSSLTPEARRKMIDERIEKSLFWRVIHTLGSLRFALFLLATIAIACAVATFFESSFNTKLAQTYIYKSPFFVGWLVVLCINLFAVTITRWPWQKKHAGFIITHYGIILLLTGAVIGMKLGFEGNVTLHKERPPATAITTFQNVLQVDNPAKGSSYVIPFDAETARPSERKPVTLAIPESDFKLVVDGFSGNLVRKQTLAASESTDARPGVAITFSSAMMNQSIPVPLSLTPGQSRQHDFFGLAGITLLDALPERKPKPAFETQVVFSKFAPIAQPHEGVATGVTIRLSEDGSTITIATPDGASGTWRCEESIGKPLLVGDATVTVREYWPDFKFVDGRPTTASNQPNNPAILVQISGPAHDPAGGRPLLELAPSPDGAAVNYQLSRQDMIYGGGSAKQGDSIPLGWADWSASFDAILPRSTVVSETVDGGDAATPEEERVPGFRARLRAPDGAEGPAQWVEAGQPVILSVGNAAIRLGYGFRLRPIPFSIRLLNFEVPRYEGTDTPANFISTIEFRDTKTGLTKEDVAKMNHPASWPGGLIANLTGWNYKFSQARWDPRDLDETTLQVLFDPGWILKWTGSLAICIGIATMFYIRPRKEMTP